MDQNIINLFDEYTHKPLNRQVFIQRLVALTGSMAAAMEVLGRLEVNYSKAVQVAEDDEDIETASITYPSGNEQVKAYMAWPSKAGKYGAVIVIHENRGLNPHIKDVTRRVAKEGYLALGVDALSPFGGTPEDEDEGRRLIGQLDRQETLTRYLNAIKFLQSHRLSNGKTGCIGFCWGGEMANRLAVNAPDLKVAVSYYGRQAPVEEVPTIKAKLVLHYGEHDERINAGIATYEKALKENGIDYELYIYKGAQHAFNNDTAPTRYHAEAAKTSWERTLKAFSEKLS